MTHKLKPLLIYILLSLLLNTKAQACLECSGSFLGGAGAVGPIISMPAYTLAQGSFAIGTSLNFLDFSGFSTSKLQELNSQSKHAHSHGNSMNVALNAAVGITDDLTVSATLPYNFLFNIYSTADGSTINEGDSIGFGDLALVAKYKIIKSTKEQLHASVLAGIKMANGQSNERDQFGYKLSSDHQPGTSSWDPIMGFAISKRFKKEWELDLSALYRISNKSSDDLIIGDVANYNIALSHSLSKLDKGKFNIDAVLELNSRWQEKMEYLGIKDEGHGGTRVFISPGLRLVYDDKWIASVALGFPIIEDLSGDQANADLQLFVNLVRVF